MRLIDYIRSWREKRRPKPVTPPAPMPVYELEISAVRIASSAWSWGQIAEQTQAAHWIWSVASIRPAVVASIEEAAHPHWRVIDDGQRDFFEIHTDAERLYREQSVCAVYFVDQVWLGNKQVIAQGSKPSAPGIYAHGIWIGAAGVTRWSLAHELGHYLGLGDVYDAGNCRVMDGRMSASSPIMTAQCNGQRLTDVEIDIARSVCQVNPSRTRCIEVL